MSVHPLRTSLAPMEGIQFLRMMSMAVANNMFVIVSAYSYAYDILYVYSHTLFTLNLKVFLSLFRCL